MKDKNKYTHLTPDRSKFYEAFKDRDTKITDDHLTAALKQDLSIFRTALWGCWLMEAYDGADGPDKKDLGDMVSHWYDILQKIEKTMEFAELAQYATSFKIPAHKSFQFIDVENLGEVTQ